MLSLLLPANEVRGKVMFLYLSVILFTGGCLPHCMLGYTPGRHSQADTPHWADTPSQETATAVDGTHPTGMHSCFSFVFISTRYKTIPENAYGTFLFTYAGFFSPLVGEYCG